jgi:hypothetical protein
MADRDDEEDDWRGEAAWEGGCCLLEGCLVAAVPALALMIVVGYQWWPLG